MFTSRIEKESSTLDPEGTIHSGDEFITPLYVTDATTLTGATVARHASNYFCPKTATIEYL